MKLEHLESLVGNVVWSLTQDQSHSLRLPAKLGKTETPNHLEGSSNFLAARRCLLEPDAGDVTPSASGSERYKPMLSACADVHSRWQPIPRVQEEIRQMEEQLREELGGRLERMAEELAAAKADSVIALQELTFELRAIKSSEMYERFDNNARAHGDHGPQKLEVEHAIEAMHLGLQKQREMISEDQNQRLLASQETAACCLKIQTLEHQIKQLASQFSKMHVDITEISTELTSNKKNNSRSG
jgi:hypothetical protein